MGGKTTLRTREKALDSIFSLWVRNSHANEYGMVKCVTCGTVDHVNDINAGHFWKRQYRSTRWHEKNVHPQCVRCNRWRSGEEALHAAYILRTYGKEEFDKLEALHWEIFKPTRAWIETMIVKYKRKLTELPIKE